MVCLCLFLFDVGYGWLGSRLLHFWDLVDLVFLPVWMQIFCEIAFPLFGFCFSGKRDSSLDLTF